MSPEAFAFGMFPNGYLPVPVTNLVTRPTPTALLFYYEFVELFLGRCSQPFVPCFLFFCFHYDYVAQ